MSNTTSVLIQGGAIVLLLLFMGVSIRYLAQKLENTEKALRDLEERVMWEGRAPREREKDDRTA